jgi:hypothetical protein
MADKQEVYLSKSKSGKCGFFTGNFLSHPLTDAEYDDLTKNPDKAKAKAQQLNYVLVNKTSESQFSMLLDLLNEFETPGLKLGALKLNTQDNCIYVTVGDTKYKYTPNVEAKAGEIYASVTGMAKHSTGKALAFLKKNATGEKLNEEVELDEAVFPETHYTWFEVTAPMINLERRGKMEHIAKGEVIGIRRATSSDGKYRLITKKRGPTIIFSVEREEYDKLKKQFKPLKGSLND